MPRAGIGLGFNPERPGMVCLRFVSCALRPGKRLSGPLNVLSQLSLDERHRGPERGHGHALELVGEFRCRARATLTLFPLKLRKLPEARIIAQRSPRRIDSQQSR